MNKESAAFFSVHDRRFYLAKKKESPGQVTFSLLGEEEKKIFRQSRDKEIKSLLDSGAIKVLTLEESKAFRKAHPDHLLTSRYVDRWKPTEAFAVLPDNFGANDPGEHRAQVAAKSRWCVVGWKDPHVHEIERSAPTPRSTSIYLFLQLVASRDWDAYAKDAKTAFLQARPTTRQQKLACSMPQDEAFPGFIAINLFCWRLKFMASSRSFMVASVPVGDPRQGVEIPCVVVRPVCPHAGFEAR